MGCIVPGILEFGGFVVGIVPVGDAVGINATFWNMASRCSGPTYVPFGGKSDPAEVR